MTNEEKANEIARDMLPYNNAEYHACYNSAMKAMEWKEQQIIKRTIDWVQKEATKHIGFNAISEECSLSLDFIDLLVKAMKGE
jgi:hypothetical protein